MEGSGQVTLESSGLGTHDVTWPSRAEEPNGRTVWAALGEGALAATLLGASDRQREIAGIPRAEPDQRHLDRFVAPAREALGPVEWDRAHARGATLGIEDAVARGVAHTGGFRSFAGRSDRSSITFGSRPVDGRSS